MHSVFYLYFIDIQHEKHLRRRKTKASKVLGK